MQDEVPQADPVTPEATPSAAALADTLHLQPAPVAARPVKPKHHTGLIGRLMIVFLVFGLIFAVLGLTGKQIPLPVWAVAEIEARANTALAKALPEGALSLGAVEVMVDSDFVPRLRLEDLRLLKPGGQTLLNLPELRVSFDPSALLHGKIRARRLKLSGAHLAINRDAEGRFDLALGPMKGAAIDSFADLFDALDRVFDLPAASSLIGIEAEAVTLTLKDQRSGKTWDLGDGRVRLDNRVKAVAAEVSFSLINAATPSRAVLTIVSEKAINQARVIAQIEDVSANDIGHFLTPLAWAGLIDAPISGRIQTTIDAKGITALEAGLSFGGGVLQPSPKARPIHFDHAAMSLLYDPTEGRMALTDLSVQSPTLRMTASGHSYLMRADGSRIFGALGAEVPDAYLTQLQFSQVMIDPEGAFQEPVQFSAGALDARLHLSPFKLEIGQIALSDPPRRLTASGTIGADARGWQAAVDLRLNRVQHDRLVALWPLSLLPNTRLWVNKNVLSGTLTEVNAALRIEPGQEPRLHLGYNFSGADVRFVNTLPPIRAGDGYATIDGQTYTMVLADGKITPPEGGEIDMAGSVFSIADVRKKPATAEITLKTSSSLTAALSLLDQPPFHFMTKADQPVNLGEGQAEIVTHLRLPLVPKIKIGDVDYQVAGTLRDVSSTRLVRGRKITAPLLQVAATPAGLTITGKGQISAVPFDVTFSQSFAPAEKGKSHISGTVVLSQATAADFGLGLPSGMVSGAGLGTVDIDLKRGEPGRLRLQSDLSRIGLAIPEIGWSKPANGKGQLDVDVRLGSLPHVDQIKISAAGLTASGEISLRAGGGLDLAKFDRVTLDDWLDAAVEIRGRGDNRAPGLALTAGTVDMRRMPSASQRKSSGSGGDSPLSVALDELRVSDGIRLNSFRGEFSLKGGINGKFTALVGGKVPMQGTAIPSKFGTAVRLQSEDAGASIAAAGLYSSARGGSLDATLTPLADEGQYDGKAQISNVSVVDTNVLADLLNAISVVGLLEQLGGDGFVFTSAEADFRLTPNAVELRHASAVGASLGVSMAGVYKTATSELRMQGVISPIYMVNGIGALFTKRGEGLFGFNYTLRGTAENPDVSVNPLSILTPGMFREIFSSPPPVLGNTAQ